MNKVLIYLLIFIIIVTGVFAFKKYIDANQLQQEVAAYQDSLDDTHGTVEKYKNLYKSKSREVKEIKSENDSLNKYLDKLDQEIHIQSNIIETLSDSIKNLETYPDTVYMEDSSFVSVRTFAKDFNWLYLSGWFEVNKPYRITFDSVYCEVDLEINYVKKEAGWDTYVDSKNSGVVIDDIKTRVITDDPSFYDKLGFNIGITGMSKYLFLYGRVSYDQLGVHLGYGTGGPVLGVDYKIK
jgi:cell division protein FtsB